MLTIGSGLARSLPISPYASAFPPALPRGFADIAIRAAISRRHACRHVLFISASLGAAGRIGVA